ncbi:aldehyde dehydrogenase family protein [Streptomyces olivochromogenes]|uniref:aldehyde dehydrogenase family protein n=1 Tax=Streptomyces olivochromogenes TaxID=1963 RepID=UPI001F1705F3|nr:aldehyde dehydrogenase family protein [Streptomyces olivochromogenes]MCF3134695.1 aldehyde dehydrogenase family protein [Streptomyces olivochromogenes]
MSSLRSRITGGQQAPANPDGPAAAHHTAVRAVSTAHQAFESWSTRPPAERSAILLQAAQLLIMRTGQVVDTMAAELRAAGQWSMFNARTAAQILIDASAAVAQPNGQVLPTPTFGAVSLQIRVPLGVIAAITPPYAPLVLGARAIALPLAMGNAVVLKPGQETPLSGGVLLREVLTEAGLPEGVLGVVAPDRDDDTDVISALVTDPRVRAVHFTGSTSAGRKVAVEAARHLKPSVLELGGKNSLLVPGDANLDYAVDAALVSSFLNAGHGCWSTERIIIDRTVADDFLSRFADKVTALPLGGPTWPAEATGTMADSRTAQRVAALIADALGKGATAVTGTGTVQADGISMAPVVLTDVTPHMDIWTQEVSGPVVAVHTVDNAQEAVALAATPPHGLTAGIITDDWAVGLSIAQRLAASAVHVNNRGVPAELAAPFGSITDSGLGRFADRAIDCFTETRWVTAGVEGRPEFPL